MYKTGNFGERHHRAGREWTKCPSSLDPLPFPWRDLSEEEESPPSTLCNRQEEQGWSAGMHTVKECDVRKGPVESKKRDAYDKRDESEQ